MGKGRKERLIPIGKSVQRILWHYMNLYRPEPANAKYDLLFLTKDGRPLSKDRIERIMARHAKKADLKGIRCSPHTLRHTSAVRFLRGGGMSFHFSACWGTVTLR